MTPKTVDRSPRKGRPGPKQCEYAGCFIATRERKPFCRKHVFEHPYVQSVLQVISDRETEWNKVAEKKNRPWRLIDLDGSLIDELLNFIRIWPGRSREGIAKELGRNRVVNNIYIKKLVLAKLVKLGKNKRGTIVVEPAY